EIVNGGFITPAWRYCHGRLRLAKRLACGRGTRSDCWLGQRPKQIRGGIDVAHPTLFKRFQMANRGIE
ncbi:MAG: hypothetical protein ACPHL9_10235, partial [Limisphaerales bacterium]